MPGDLTSFDFEHKAVSFGSTATFFQINVNFFQLNSGFFETLWVAGDFSQLIFA